MRRQGPVDRFDESVGERDRIQPGEFTLDPGMRAQAGQFTDVTSPGYAAQAAAQAERGGAMEFGTSVGAGRDAGRDALIMEIVGMVLATMAGAGPRHGGYAPAAGAKFHGMTGQPINAGVSRLSPPARPFQGTTAQTGALQGNYPIGQLGMSPGRAPLPGREMLDATDDLMNRIMQAKHARRFPGLDMGGRPIQQ
jgi:hypothetical protein